MSKDYSQILWDAYNQFLLPLGGKKVPTPYRRNEAGSFQKVGPEFQGKSSPEVLTETTIKLSKEQNFNLDKASVEEIRQFMKRNRLGIDCSGFAYRTLNYLVQETTGKNLEAFGLPHVGRTNVSRLTSDEFSIPIENFANSQAGDIIRLNSGGDILHALVILDTENGIITYAHSSSVTNPDGVHTDQIKGGNFTDDLKDFSYNTEDGDGIRRLKALT